MAIASFTDILWLHDYGLRGGRVLLGFGKKISLTYSWHLRRMTEVAFTSLTGAAGRNMGRRGLGERCEGRRGGEGRGGRGRASIWDILLQLNEILVIKGYVALLSQHPYLTNLHPSLLLSSSFSRGFFSSLFQFVVRLRVMITIL